MTFLREFSHKIKRTKYLTTNSNNFHSLLFILLTIYITVFRSMNNICIRFTSLIYAWYTVRGEGAQRHEPLQIGAEPLNFGGKTLKVAELGRIVSSSRERIQTLHDAHYH